MKKLLFLSMALSGLCFQCASTLLMAQVPNGNFESWTSKNATSPENWSTLGLISKTSGSAGGNAIKLSNNATNGTFSMALMVAFDTGAFYAPHYVYSGTPDSITIVYKSTLGNDTGSISIAFTKAGLDFPVAFADLRISGNSSNWVSKTFPVEYIQITPSLVADSGYIIISSADEVNGPESSGSLEIDHITFKYAGNGAAPNIPNHSFENWHSNSVEFPNNWVSHALLLNDQGVKINSTSKSTDKFEGSYAIEIAPFVGTNPETGFDDTFMGAAVTTKAGIQSVDADLNLASFPINQRYTSFRGMYKSNLNLGDAAIVWVNIFNDDTIVGSAFYSSIDNHSNYVEFSADITWDTTYLGMPDAATVALFVTDSSQFGDVNSLNSKAWFDQLRFDNWISNTQQLETHIKSGIYPNPSAGLSQIKINSPAPAKLELSILNSNGATIRNWVQEIGAGKSMLPLDLSAETSGVYFLQIRTESQIIHHKIFLTP